MGTDSFMGNGHIKQDSIQYAAELSILLRKFWDLAAGAPVGASAKLY